LLKKQLLAKVAGVFYICSFDGVAGLSGSAEAAPPAARRNRPVDAQRG
jgi:hypothetical protein